MEYSTKCNLSFNSNNLPRLIGITGRKFNGKDTLGNYYVEQHGYIRLAFADALKNVCANIFNFSEEQLYGNKKEEIDEFWNVSPRTIFQYVGTELLRDQLDKVIPNVGKDIWIKVIEKKIFDILKINPNVKFVITDVRFSNECNFIKTMGGVMIRVTRDCVNKLNNLNNYHSSEMEIDNLIVDIDLKNDGSIEDLLNLANEITHFSSL